MSFNAYIINYEIAFHEQKCCKLLLTRPTCLRYLPIMFDANCISIVCVIYKWESFTKNVSTISSDNELAHKDIMRF